MNIIKNLNFCTFFPKNLGKFGPIGPKIVKWLYDNEIWHVYQICDVDNEYDKKYILFHFFPKNLGKFGPIGLKIIKWS